MALVRARESASDGALCKHHILRSRSNRRCVALKIATRSYLLALSCSAEVVVFFDHPIPF
jgi:hypothetical protein